MSSTSHQRATSFLFKTGDLVLVKWNDGMVYFAKIKKIDRKRSKCQVVFDDKSQDEAMFSQIHSVDETTTDIICIKCKKDDSDFPNEIVLCDTCGIGYHQKCHSPNIPANALNIDTPWKCIYCIRGDKCPFLTESLDVLQNLLSEGSHSESDAEVVTSNRATRRSKRGLRTSKSPTFERKKSPLVHSEVSKPKPSSNSHQQLLTVPEDVYTPESTPESTISISSEKKAKKKHAHRKRYKRMSVDTQTLSITTSGAEVVLANREKKPRNLRISWTIDDSESGVKIKTPLNNSAYDDAFQTITLPSTDLPQASANDDQSSLEEPVSKTDTNLPLAENTKKPFEKSSTTPSPLQNDKKLFEDNPCEKNTSSPSEPSFPQFPDSNKVENAQPSQSESPKPLTPEDKSPLEIPIKAPITKEETPTVVPNNPTEPTVFTVTPLPSNGSNQQAPFKKTPKLTAKRKAVEIPDFDSFDDLFDIPSGTMIKSKPATKPQEADKDLSGSEHPYKELPTPTTTVIKMVTKGEVTSTSTHSQVENSNLTAKVGGEEKPAQDTDVKAARKISTSPVISPTATVASSVDKTSAVIVSKLSSPLASVPSKRALPDDVIITGVGRSSPPAPKRPHTSTEPIRTPIAHSRPAVGPSTPGMPTTSIHSPLVDKTQLLCYVSTQGGQPVYLPAGILPRGHRRKDLVPHQPTNGPIYYTSEVESPAHVNTTKPYAIVTALPSTGAYQQQIIQPVSTTKGSVIMESPTLLEKHKATSPPSYSSIVEEKSSGSQEKILLSGFDSAWKQLQANGWKYKSSVTTKPHSSLKGGKSSRLVYGRSRPVSNYKPQAAGKIGRVCSLCGSDATYLCSGCKTEWYCGRECQLKSWDKHSEFCKC